MQLAAHGELYINIGTQKQVDISLEKPTQERQFRETGLGRQDTNINHSIQCFSTIAYLYFTFLSSLNS